MKRFFSPRTEPVANGRKHPLAALGTDGRTEPVDGTATRLAGESIGSVRTGAVGTEVS